MPVLHFWGFGLTFRRTDVRRSVIASATVSVGAAASGIRDDTAEQNNCGWIADDCVAAVEGSEALFVDDDDDYGSSKDQKILNNKKR